MESINAVNDDAASKQQKPECSITTEEKSATAPVSKKAIGIATSDIILPDDDDDATRHTFSSRQKMQEAAGRRRNMSGIQNKQQRSKNINSAGIIISPLSAGTNVLQGESRKQINNDMKWSTIGKTKLSGLQELDKLASLMPQPVSPECSVEEIEEGENTQQMMMAAVSPEASSFATASHQKQQLLHSTFKTPGKATTNHQNSHEPSSEEETPITELFKYYNFSTDNNNNSSSSSKINTSKLSPATFNLLETSPFRISGKLLDDQLQSVLEADRNMDRKIEQMEKDLDDNESYMGSPMSGSPNGRYPSFDSSDDDDSDDDDDDTNDESKDEIRSNSKDESMSTISDVISELSVVADTAYFQHLQSPETNSDDEFLTPKSRLVAKGRRTAGTAYYTARNDLNGDTKREGNEESRMYDSDSETYSVRRMHIQQQQQDNLKPRSASHDVVSSRATIDMDVNANTRSVQEKVRCHSMSPPAELRTTRVLWSDDATPMRVASLNWEFDAEEKPSNKRGLSSGMKKKKRWKPPTPFSYPVKQNYDASTSAMLASSTPTHSSDRASSKKTNTLSNACPLQLGRISEEQSDSQAQPERTEFLNLINTMRIQLTQLEDERDSLVLQRDEQAKGCNEYKKEKESLSAQINTLEEEVQISLQVVENVKETLASKIDETDCLKQLLHKSEENLGSLRRTLLSKEDKVEELSMALKDKEGVLESRLQLAEDERLSEIDRVTSEMQQVHSKEIANLESELREAHGHELDHTKATLANDFKEKSGELMENNALMVEQLQTSSSEDVARVRCEAEKEHLAAVEAMALNHEQEIAGIVERLNTSQSQVIEGLKAAHNEEVKVLQDGFQVLKESEEKLRKEKDDFVTQISLLKEANEGFAETLSSQEEEHHKSLEAARHRDKLSSDSYNEVEAMLKEAVVNLALVRAENEALQETVTNLTKSLEAKHADFEGAVHEKDAIQSDMKRQLLDSQTEIDSMTLAYTALESKYAALLQENDSVKESNSTLNEANSALQASLSEVSDNLSVVTLEKEELVASLEDATSNMKTLEDRIASADSELEMQKRRSAELSKENKESTTQIKHLQLEVESANQEKDELNALKCLEREVREQLEASDDERKCLKEEIAELQSHLLGANKDREHLSRELQGITSLREEMTIDNQSNVTRISELQSEVRALSRVKHILQLKSDKFESLNASAAVELDERNKEIARLSGENDGAKADLVQLKSKLQFEIENTANLNADKSNVEVQLKCIDSERGDMQRKLDEAMISCETLTLSLENARLQIQLKSDEIDSLNASATAKLDGVSETMDVLREENFANKAELEELLSKLQYESKKMTDVLSENTSMEMQLNSFQQERDGLQQKFDEAVVSCESMSLSLEDARSQIHAQSNEIESINISSAAEIGDVKKKLDVLSEENIATKTELELLRSEKSSLEMQLNSIKDERTDLQRRFDDTTVSLEDARSQFQVQSSELELLTTSTASVREEVSKKMDDLQEDKSVVELQLESMQQERDDLQQKFDEAVVSCESMSLSLEDACSQIHAQSNEIEPIYISSAAEIGDVKKTLEVLSEENIATKTELELLRSEKTSLEMQLNSIKDERTDLQRRFDDTTVSLEDARSQFQVQSSELELLTTSTASVREEVSKKMDALQEDKSVVELQLESMQRERDDLQQKFDEAVVSCESMSLSLEDARSQIHAQSRELESLNVFAEAERAEVNKVIVALQEEKSSVVLQLKAMQQERDGLQQKFDEAVLSCESMLLSLEDARSQIHAQTNEIGLLNTCAASEGVEVKKKLDVLSEENIATKAEVGLLRSEKSSMVVQLSAIKDERADLQQRFDEAMVSCESMLLSLEDARRQIQVQSSEIELLNTKSGVELQLRSTQQERHDLREKFDEAAVSCESMLLSLEDARSFQVQGMGAELAEKADAFTRLQAIAAKLAVNVLQLKFKSKTEVERNDVLTVEIQSKNERVTSLETCLDELKNDDRVEQNLKSTVAKLALALIKLKARERRALAVQQTLEASNIELLAKLGILSKENEGMEEGMTALTDKMSALELDSSSNQSSIDVLQKAVSEKGAEVKRLGVLLAGKDEAIRDLMSEMQKIRSDVVNGVKKLELENASAMKARANLEEELEGVNVQLNREREFGFDLQSQLEQTISERAVIVDDMVDLQGTNVHLENHLEQVAQDRTHLRSQIEDMHDSIAALEADKDSLLMKLEEHEEQADQFTTKIATLETDARSKARQIDYMEFQLVAKMDEAEALNKMVVSHEATMKDLNDEIEAMDAKRIETEESLSSLHSMMDTVANERDGLASQLQSAIKELQSVRAESGECRSSAGSSLALTTRKDDTSQESDDLASSPGRGIRKILESSKLSREDIDFICSNMDKLKTTLTEVGKERRFLKKEVKRLLAELEHAQGELTTVKKNCKVMNQQTIALRGDVNEARSLLKKYEEEKNQLTSDLDAAHEAMDQIQRCSSESYNALVKQSQDEISALRSEMESKDEAIERLQALRNDHISRSDVTSSSIQSSQQPTVVTSTERFKLEKGQSMFGILKGKRSKRKGKDQISYRKRK